MPRCPNLVDRGYCPTHKAQQPERKRPDGSQAYYNSVHWQKTRRVIRARDPICKGCKRKPSQTVDHIDGNWRNNDPNNLQGLCKTCHDTKSAHQHNAKKVSA